MPVERLKTVGSSDNDSGSRERLQRQLDAGLVEGDPKPGVWGEDWADAGWADSGSSRLRTSLRKAMHGSNYLAERATLER